VSKLAAFRRGWVSLSQGKGSTLGNIFCFYKTRHILLSDSANCTALRAVVLTQYRRVTDRRTDGQADGISVVSTALAMRALWRAVKTTETKFKLARKVAMYSIERYIKLCHVMSRVKS